MPLPDQVNPVSCSAAPPLAWCGLSSAAIVFLTVLLACGLASMRLEAAEVKVSLVAADRPGRPLVSQLSEFRASPYGGLIAVDWVSAATVQNQPLFPVVLTDRTVPSLETAKAGSILAAKGQEDEALDSMVDEIEHAPAEPGGSNASIDSLYRGKLIRGLAVGPKHARRSDARLALAAPTVLLPGRVPLLPDRAAQSIDCYPVTFVASDGVTGITFVPELTWEGRDLLGDLLFEYSPEMPLGDLAVLTAAEAKLPPAERLERLRGMAGGKRQFRRLTLYLPASGVVPYTFCGFAFLLGPEGVRLVDAEANARGESVTLTPGDRFGVTLLRPRPPAGTNTRSLPLVRELRNGITSSVDSLTVPITGGSVRLRINVPGQAPGELGLLLPAAADLPLQALVLVAGTDEAPVLRWVALPPATATGSGILTLALAQVTATGPGALPLAFAGQLTPWPRAGGVLATGGTLHFTRQSVDAESARYTASLAGVAPGFYGLTLELKPAAVVTLPVTIAAADSAGAATLLTYHNREDYLRGEELQAAMVVRTARAEVSTEATLTVTHESGEVRELGRVSLCCAAGATTTRFVKLDTGRLRIGRYLLELKGASRLVTRGLAFTVYPEQPESSFALFHWADSFCNGAKAGNQLLVNVLSADPKTVFSASELQGLMHQATIPEAFIPWLEREPLLPPPEAARGYDPDTEAIMAAMLRLGIRYAPEYGWGLDPYEAAWNPKHTLVEDLDRMHRLCLQVTQRYRDFGNFAGLQLNWYPTIDGYWETNPAVDGNAGRRRAQLQQECAVVAGKPAGTLDGKRLAALASDDPVYVSAEAQQVRDTLLQTHAYRTGALPRAYAAWTAGSRRCAAGAGEARLAPPAALSADAGDLQAGLFPDRPLYLSNVPVNWFDQVNYYPPLYFATLPVAGVHAYTDYGYAPFQPLWALDHYAAGLGDKPVWLTSMSAPRATLFQHGLLSLARGADGLSLKAEGDPASWQVLGRFLKHYGPALRRLRPHSDVVILDSLRQQLCEGSLAGAWQGYAGGPYLELYTKLWYAGWPPAMLTEQEIAAGGLAGRQALFLVNQRVPLPAEVMAAIAAFRAAGGRVFKDDKTAATFPGETFSLTPTPPEQLARRWDLEQYCKTKDRAFVGTLAAYESVATPLAALLAQLPPPRVVADSADIRVCQMDGQDVSVVVAVNDTHPGPGLTLGWNFWANMILARDAVLSFARPGTVYELLGGGAQALTAGPDGRCPLPVHFNQLPGRVFLRLDKPIDSLVLRAPATSTGGWISVQAELHAGGRVIRDAMPCEITVVDEHGQVAETLYRGLGPGCAAAVRLPVEAVAGTWTLRVRDLVSGRTAAAAVQKGIAPAMAMTSSPVLIIRPSEVVAFFRAPVPDALPRYGTAEEARRDPLVQVALEPPAAVSAPVLRQLLVLLDRDQLAAGQPAAAELPGMAETLRQAAQAQGCTATVRVVGDVDVVEIPLRFSPTTQDRQNLQAARDGTIVACARSLSGKYQPTGKAMDFLDPESGYAEPGARHRIFNDVILLGNPAGNRFLDDLHRTAGVRASAAFPAPGSALVQVIHDGFTAHHDVLSIQATDSAGLRAGVAEILGLLKDCAAAPAPVTAATGGDELKSWPDDGKPTVGESADRELGCPVTPLTVLPDGSLLATADTARYNYVIVGPDGGIRKQWLGKYDITVSGQGNAFWLSGWYTDWPYVNHIIRATPELQLDWMMPGPARGGSFQYWTYPGTQKLPDPASDDLLVCGATRVFRLTPEGRMLWHYDELEACNEPEAFRFPRELMLHDISADGRYLLVAAFGVKPYSHYVSGFLRPAVILFEARSGKLLWEKGGYLVNQSVCRFAGPERILVGDATLGAKRLVLLDLNGRETWSLARPEGTSAGTLTADGAWLVVRPEAERDRLWKIMAPPQGLQTIHVADRTVRELPLPAPVVSWTCAPGTGQITASLEDGTLVAFHPDGTRLWQTRLAGPCQLALTRDGKTLVAGTGTGQLLWLDDQGHTRRQLDLMELNRVTEPARFVTEFMRSPAATPTRDLAPEALPGIDQRCGNTVKFSANLLAGNPQLQALTATAFKGKVTMELPQVAGVTYVFAAGLHTAGAANLRLTVSGPAGKPPVLSTRLQASQTGEERTVAWRPATTAPVALTLEYDVPADGPGIACRNPAVFALTFTSRNLLRQGGIMEPKTGKGKAPEAGESDDLGAATAPEPADAGLGAPPPKIQYFLPNDLDLAAAARGAPPYKPVVWPDLPFNGALVDNRDTSWLGSSLTALSSHATLTLTFPKPVTLTTVAVYEDVSAPGRLTARAAVFARDSKTHQWRQVGHLEDNRNPFSLFTFAPVVTDQILYLWLKSADGHARLAELEAYGPDVLD